jgi:hypothetical protein
MYGLTLLKISNFFLQSYGEKYVVISIIQFFGPNLHIVVITIVGVLYPGYSRSPVTAQKSGYDQFPPAAHGSGTKHPVSDKVPPLLAEEEMPPT